MARQIIKLKRPEGGAEHGVTFWRNHDCSAASVYRQEEGFENIDLVLFPVGIVGYEMPAGVPFEVQTIAPCEACNTYLKQMFMWTSSKVYLP